MLLFYEYRRTNQVIGEITSLQPAKTHKTSCIFDSLIEIRVDKYVVVGHITHTTYREKQISYVQNQFEVKRRCFLEKK